MIDKLIVEKILRAFENNDVCAIRTAIVQHQIDINALIESRGVSLMHLIIGHKSERFAYKTTKLFLNCGGNPNVQSSDGVTPIHVAAAWGRNQILHLLLINGGDPWIQDDEKKNAFEYAFEEQEWNTIKLLHHFQKMHSAINFKAGPTIKNCKFQLDMNSSRKGEQMLVHSPIKYINKSVMTETHFPLCGLSSCLVQDKVRHFEPSEVLLLENSCRKKEGKSNRNNCLNSICETNKISIIGNSDEPCQDFSKQKATFISSFQISATSKHGSLLSLVNNYSEPKNVRGRLFLELQEAVYRRSKRKLAEEAESNANPKSLVISNLDSESDEPKDSRSGQFVFSEKKKNEAMSDTNARESLDFIEESVAEEMKRTNYQDEKTIDLCGSSSESTSPCGDSAKETDFLWRTGSPSMRTLVTPQYNSDTSTTAYLTPNNMTLNDLTKAEDSNTSFVSVSEENKCPDAEEKDVMVLEEKLKLVVTPFASISMENGRRNEDEVDENAVDVDNSSAASSSCDSDVLRGQLLGLGQNVGPVTKTTKKLYLKKLLRIRKELEARGRAITNGEQVVHSALSQEMLGNETLEVIQSYHSLEEQMCRSFEKWSKRQWREGAYKTSFNYLLLDPRLSSNLPRRAGNMTDFEAWKCFLSSIFYVGKGKKNRPHDHLYQAAAFWRDRSKKSDDKIALITDIWKEGLGVVCLQIFQNIIPVEAYTREAAMIEALGVANIKNAKIGEYYGIASAWSSKDKRNLGLYLLYKAYRIFLNEGERQIKPHEL